MSKPELNLIYTIMEAIVAVMAVIGNGLVIIVFWSDKRLRRRTNYYIISLATADFLVGLFGIPFAIMTSIGLPRNLYACLFTLSVLLVLCTISILCLVAVSVDRYWAILYPLEYARTVSTRTTISMIGICWLCGMIIGFLPLFGWHEAYEEDFFCLFVEVMDYDYLVFLYITTIITPSILLIGFYVRIYQVIIRQKRKMISDTEPSASIVTETFRSLTVQSYNSQRNTTKKRVIGAARKREMKSTQNLSVIVLFFMLCWLPLYTINCINAFCKTCFIHPNVTYSCIVLSHLNSAVNPLLYAYHLKDFRCALKAFILSIIGFEETTNNQIPLRQFYINRYM